MADNGQAYQFENMMTLYNEVLSAHGKKSSDYPLYLAIGNHDYPSANGAFLEYATLPDGSHPTDTSYDFWLNGYHYIFLGSDTPSGLSATFTEATLNWLDSKLAENRDPSRPVFIFLHQSIYNTVSGSLPGEGWHGVTNADKFTAVLKKYPEVLMFNGHSHWTMDSKGNMYEATEELPINIFNCASVSYLWSGYNSVSGAHLDGSQGYFVQIYDNKILVRGRDFAASEWVSSAQYLVELEDACGGEHKYELTAVEYANGFDKAGEASYKCSICDKVYKEDLLPIIAPKGYSVSLYESDTKGFCYGYNVSPSAKALYERANGVVLDLGVVIIDPTRASGETFFTNGELTSNNGAININVTKASLLNVDVSVKNIGESQLDIGVIISAYVTIIEGEDEKTYKTSFIQYESENRAGTHQKLDATLYSSSYNSCYKEKE